ncbi:DegT/DnrJ/EryC1/StrS family aminotransferase [Proteinivorax hydrogeniformans]|uniref:DegT/DnrJ/EryC1/StrS family aminotransferase n=1 Tax=Proteinivorax hydrogeniformans TaxID=1826727 RepID=A0AAU8HWY1_9FIRM
MKIQVTRSSLPEFEEYVDEIKDLWDSRWLTNMGVKHKQLEAELEDYLAVKDVSLFTNGHLALEMAIESMGLEGEVITTPFTFASTTHAIVRNGLEPVFCDVNSDDFNIDVEKLESLITDRTTAIIPVHVFGNICDVKTIDKIANKYNLKVIYDAAHAFGVTIDGVSVANFGDASMFSFHATKVFNTIEGGALTSNHQVLKDKLNALKNFGMNCSGNIDYIGGNAKMSEFQAAMGLCNLRHIEDDISKRKQIVNRYRGNLGDIREIKFIKEQKGVRSNYSYLPVLFKGYKQNRDEVFEKLKKQGVTPRKYFYPLTSDFPCYKGRFNQSYTPVAKEISEKILCLPLYADLSLKDVDRICEIILS